MSIERKGQIPWHYRGRLIRNLRCFIGLHNGWYPDIYTGETVSKFTYCPNCHEERTS